MLDGLDIPELASSPPGDVVIWSYGAGVDGTAALIECVRRNIQPPHAIVFADTGGEKPETYAYLDIFDRWLVDHGYPAVTRLFPVNRAQERLTLEGECLRVGKMPSLAYGYKTCSQRFKVDPQIKWANRDPVCRAEVKAGRKFVKAIGYNFDEGDRAKLYADKKSVNWYPLIAWQISRAMAVAIILDAGLPLPPKSACFFCPASTTTQILALAQRNPDLMHRALTIEDRAAASMKTVKGLGRRFNWRAFLDGKGVTIDSAIYDQRPCECHSGL